MRAVFFLLLLANLAFLAWAEWIDVPQPAASNDVYARLPRLKLVGEEPRENKRPSSGRARKTAMQPPPPAAQCLSVGPFDDEASAASGASLLSAKGLTPRQRTQQAEISKGYWVYIGGLKTDHDVTEVLRTLQQSHVDDAKVMQDTDDAHRVSVGLFSDRDRADRRAQSIKKLGLEPEIAERKVPARVFWMDVDVPSGSPPPTAQDLTTGATLTTAATAASAATPVPATTLTPVRVIPCPTSSPDTTVPLPTAPTAPLRTKVATGASKVP